jgi:DNA-binding NtrC family response regulator
MKNPDDPPATKGTPVAAPWILAVDDDTSMLSLVETVLGAQGWLVRVADGAEEALHIIKQAANPPFLVICDVLMPRMDGLELVRRLCARIPGLKVIFISGRLTDVSWWPDDLQDRRFLEKPFENAQLVAAVNKTVGDGNRPG